jgi:predicted RNase H-like HicB family nuclease
MSRQMSATVSEAMALKHYWAIVEKSSDGYYTHFPDLPGATAAGDTVEESLAVAADVAAYHLQHMIEEQRPVPEPTLLEKLPRDPEVKVYARSLVAVSMPGKAVRVNITIDEGLLARIDREATEKGSNRSAFLAELAQERLAKRLAPSRAGSAARARQRRRA